MHRHLILLFFLAALLPGKSLAQVPRFEATPFDMLANLNSMDASTRRSAASGLAAFRKSPEALKALIKALYEDPDVSVRQSAATSLAKMGAKGKSALVYSAICDPDASTRRGLVDFGRRAKIRCDEHKVSLKGTDPLPSAQKELFAFLEHPSAATRHAAMKKVSKLNNKKGNKKIWVMATADPVWKIRARAVKVITKAYGKKALQVLRHTLTQDPDARVRSRALYGLGHIKAPQAAKLIASSARAEQIPEMQFAAIKALAKLANNAAIKELSRLAEAHSDEEIRAAAVKAMASMKGNRKRIKEIMAKVLRHDRSGEVRAAALKVLSSDSSDTACIARAESINDPHPAVRGALISQLAKCKPSIARPALKKAAKGDKDGKVRQEAAKVLIKMGASKSMGVLIYLLQRDRDVEVRKVILAAVSKLPKKAHMRVLADVAKNDPEVKLRLKAVKILASGSSKAVPALVHVLARDRETGVRLLAAKSLGRYKDAMAYKALTKAAASDPSADVRKAAASGAAKSPAQKAWVNSLLMQTIDPEVSVRLKAVAQLCKMHVPRTYSVLVRALWMDESPAVRVAVAKGFSDVDHPLIDVGLVVAHDTDDNGSIVRAVEKTQKQRFGRLNELLEKAKSENAKERKEAIKDIYPSPFKKVRAALEELVVKDDSPKVRRAAANELAKYKDRKALTKLMQASQGETHSKTRQRKIRLYTKLRKDWGAARRVLHLSKVMQQARSSDKVAKLRGLYALGILKDRRSYSVLQGALKSKMAEERYAAAVSMAIFGNMSVVAKVLAKEKDAKVKQRLIKLKILRKSPDEVLTALISDNPSDVLAALHATAIKPNNRFVPAIVRIAMAHLDKEVRLAAVRTLVLHDYPLAHWAIRIASAYDAKKKIRKLMWAWAVFADSTAGN